MKMIKTMLILLVCLVGAATAQAQDIIIKKNGDKVKVIVKEINDTQVKYVEFDDPNEILFTMDRALISEIKFAYGKKYKEEAPSEVADYFAEDGNNNILVNFTSIGNNAIILTYERAIDAGSSFDITGKLLGVGINDNNTAYSKSGFGIDVGYKFKFGSVFNKTGEYRPKHLLHGSYFKPTLGFASASEGDDYYTYDYNYFHFGLQVGKQWVIQQKLSLDLFIGFHYYGGKHDYIDLNGFDYPYEREFNDGDLAGSNNRAVSFGLRVGYVFGQYGFKDSKSRR